MLHECAVYATAEVLFQLHNSNPTVRTLICEGQEAAAFPLLDGHFRHHRYSCSGGYHSQDGSELAALKNHIRLQPGASASGQRVFAKAVTLFHQYKSVVRDLRHVNP